MEQDIDHAPEEHVWQIAPLQDAVRRWHRDEHDTALGRIAGVVGHIEAQIGRLDVAGFFLGIARDTLEQLHAANPDSAQAARDVMISLERISVSEGGGRAGGAVEALEFQKRALGIALRLRESDPQSIFYGRTAAVACFLTYQRAKAAGQQQLADQCLGEVLHELTTAGCQLDLQMMDLYRQLQAHFGSGK